MYDRVECRLLLNAYIRFVVLLIFFVNQKQDSNIEVVKFYFRVFSMFGNWLVEIYLENFNIIMEDYLEKVIGIINIGD